MKFHEVPNLLLLKKLPYDIKLTLYVAVLTNHQKRKEWTDSRSDLTYRYDDVIKTIDNWPDTVSINAALIPLRKQRIAKDDICSPERLRYPNCYFHVKILESQRTTKRNSLLKISGFTICFNCPVIAEKYNNSVYVYWLCDGWWSKFDLPLPYHSFLRIPNVDIKIYHTFMISNDDITDPTLSQVEIEQMIKNAIFKFSVYELIKPSFSFKDENIHYKNRCHDTLSYTMKRCREGTLFGRFAPALFNSLAPALNYIEFDTIDYPRYNTLYNNMLFKYNDTSQKLPNSIVNFNKIDFRKTASEQALKYYKILWRTADDSIIDKISSQITNFHSLVYERY